jgi:hypothetical protein
MKAVVNVGALLLALAAASVAPAQNYALDWFTIDGGGGSSSGGVFTISGTIGQPDAGARLTGGNFRLDGGFWGVIAAAPTEPVPSLTIVYTNNSVVISWPSPSTGWKLQENSVLGTANWTDAGQTPIDDGAIKSVIVSPPTGRKFYRLYKP